VTPTTATRAADRIVFACDVPRLEEARALVERVGDEVGMIKVGLELFVAAGPAACALGAAAPGGLFLDLKLHDIPETVERAVERAASLGARILTVHATGGPAMLAAAVRRAGACTIAAVTVLTSLDTSDLATVGVGASPADHALALARMAHEAGVRAFVCSVHEARAMRAALGPEAILITPGIRPAGAADGDQKRVATPRAAVEAGADLLVVGRPIRDAADPAAAARAVAEEIASCLRA